MINLKYLGCLFDLPADIDPPPFEVIQDFVNTFIVEEITEPCVDAMCPRRFGRSILRNTVPTDVKIAFYSCGQVGYSLADMTPDIQYWLKAGFHGPCIIRRFDCPENPDKEIYTGSDRYFWTTINDFIDEGSYIFSNEQTASFIQVNGNSEAKDFVIYDRQTQAGFETDEPFSDWPRKPSNQNQFENFYRLLLHPNMAKKHTFFVLSIHVSKSA